MMFDQVQQQSVLSDVVAAFRDIGYRPSWMRHHFTFADFYSQGTPSRTIDLGVFGQEPLDYRSACFGLHFCRPGVSADHELNSVRALGAPQVFYVRNGKTQRWQIRSDGVLLTEEFPTTNISARIKEARNIWGPQAVLRAKTGFEPISHRQMDFVDIGLLPALEHEAANKIDALVRCTCANAEANYSRRGAKFDAAAIFSLIFQLLVGKLLTDRKIQTTPVINFGQPETVLSAVRNHYPSQDQQALKHITFPATMLKELSQEIGASFSFANLSVETLTYVYENTFVSGPSRKKLGIHSTPSYLADYVLAQMPIDELPRRKWHVVDPTCGHGIFLVAAMRRMRALLPPEWSGRQRHEFFARHIHGVDIEKFSIEVARLCLMLADFPEANGWDLINQDIFAGNLLEEVSSKATIFVGNPPFEALPDRTPLIRKPAELLSRALPNMPEGGLIGIVLPRAFLDGSDYRAQRQTLLDGFDILSITGLPDRIFAHSDAVTAVVVARKGETTGRQVHFSEVLDRDKDNFRRAFKTTWDDYVSKDFLRATQSDRLIVPVLREVWEYLAGSPVLEEITEIATGIRYVSETHQPNRGPVFFNRPGPNRRHGIDKVTNAFMQYVGSEEVFFSMDPSVQENSAWQYDWDSNKVIVPASRNSRGPWRYAALLDTKGRCASRRFYAVWPKIEPLHIPAAAVAALLNSPIATAFVYAHSFQTDIPVRVYESIPLPPLAALAGAADTLAKLVGQYVETVSLPLFNEERAREAILKIDAAVLQLYALPPRLERELLDLFWATQRRVPFSFTGYIPPEYKPWIPLHKYLATSASTAAARNVMQQLPVITDRKTLDFLESLTCD